MKQLILSLRLINPIVPDGLIDFCSPTATCLVAHQQDGTKSRQPLRSFTIMKGVLFIESIFFCITNFKNCLLSLDKERGILLLYCCSDVSLLADVSQTHHANLTLKTPDRDNG